MPASPEDVGLSFAILSLGAMLVNYAVKSPTISIARDEPTSPDEDLDIDHHLPRGLFTPASLTISSADNSPGTYFGNLAAGKIDNNEMPATIKNDARKERSRALALIATTSSTSSGVADVAASTVFSS